MPVLLPEVLELTGRTTVGWPGAPGAVTPVPPLPGTWTTVSEYGATVTDEAELWLRRGDRRGVGRERVDGRRARRREPVVGQADRVGVGRILVVDQDVERAARGADRVHPDQGVARGGGDHLVAGRAELGEHLDRVVRARTACRRPARRSRRSSSLLENMPWSPKSVAPSTVLTVPSPLCSFQQSTLAAPFSSQVMYMSAVNSAPGWVSRSTVEFVSVTRIGTLAGLLMPGVLADLAVQRGDDAGDVLRVGEHPGGGGAARVVVHDHALGVRSRARSARSGSRIAGTASS